MKKFFIRFKYYENLQYSLILTIREDSVIDLTTTSLKRILANHPDFHPAGGALIVPANFDVMIMMPLN